MAIYTMNDGTVDHALQMLLGTREASSTGFAELDEMLKGGFQNGYLYVLAARPAMGKMAFALSVASNLCRQGKKVRILTSEMNAEILIKRMITGLARGDKTKYENAAESIKKYDLIIVDSADFPEEVMCAKDIDLIIMDESQYDHFGGMQTKTLKKFAHKVKLPVLVLCKLSRNLEHRFQKNRRPRWSDLNENVGRFADVVMFLYRDEYYYRESKRKGIAEIDIEKNLTGYCGTCELKYLDYGWFC